MRTSFESFSHKYREEIEKTMENFIASFCSDERLKEAMLYSLQAGGKRFRPLLLLATIEFCEKEITQGAIEVAAALEMVHTYSLIHDDLPAMDDDDLRRGKPTSHKVFGEGMAILAGDGLLTEAFHLMSESHLVDHVKIELLQLFSYAAGSAGMVAGQSLDIASEGMHLDLKKLQSIHVRKTGALIEYAVTAGAVLASQSSESKEWLQQYGQNLGVAFQIKDDLLDVTGDVSLLGKATGKDQLLGKNTYPELLGVEGAEEALKEHIGFAKEALENCRQLFGTTCEGSLLEDLLNKLVR